MVSAHNEKPLFSVYHQFGCAGRQLFSLSSSLSLWAGEVTDTLTHSDFVCHVMNWPCIVLHSRGNAAI